MQNPEQPEEVPKSPPKVYNYLDLLQFESKEKYSSIGRMIDSTKPSAAKYGFGTADRQKQAKVFQSKELSKTAFIGKTSQIHAYTLDNYTYVKNKVTQIKFK